LKRTLDVFSQAAKEGRKNLLETEAKTVLIDYGIPVAKSELARNEGEAIGSAEKMGFPVVLKIVSPDIIHKSDVGGVKLNLNNAEEVHSAYKDILSNVKKQRIKTIFGQSRNKHAR
jgi:acyl-CoA synthetase (NDP forming)